MFMEQSIPNRQAGEKLVMFIRRHWVIIIGQWLGYTVLALVPMGIYFFLVYQFPLVLTNGIFYPILLLLASLYYLFTLLFFYNSFVDYYLDVWIITNKRIIDIEQKGLFSRQVSEHELDKIQDVTAEQKGIFPTFLTYGDIKVQTAGQVPMFVFHQIDNPFEVAKTINHLLKDIPRKEIPTETPGAPKKESLIEKILNE